MVSPAPHIKCGEDTGHIMRDVVIALLPALFMSVYVFGLRAALVIAVCVVSCVASEWGFQKLTNRPITITDFSAVITGVLLAFNLPVTIPLWIAVFGCIVAIVVVKQLFGGIGKNFANPAITARVVLTASFGAEMTNWVIPNGTDLVAGATPMAILATDAGLMAAKTSATISAGDPATMLPSILDMFIGNIGGSLGETSALALILGGVYLIYRKVISPIIPVTFIGTVFVLTALLGQAPMYQLLGGGLMLGAFFMATDYVTSPATTNGRIIFGIGCGILTVIIRVYGNFPEGVSFAILLMNIATPLIIRYTYTKPFGGGK